MSKTNNDDPFMDNKPKASTEPKDKWQERKIGALWLRESEGGKKRYTGELVFNDKTINIVVFKNGSKFDPKYKPDVDKSKWPDHIIYIDERKETKS